MVVGGYWQDGAFVQFPRTTGWSKGGYNLFGEYVPPGNTWGNAVSDAAVDLLPGLAGNVLVGVGLYDAYKVGRDIYNRHSVNKDNYEMAIYGKRKAIMPGGNRRMKRPRGPHASNALNPHRGQLYGPNVEVGKDTLLTHSYLNYGRKARNTRLGWAAKDTVKNGTFFFQGMKPYSATTRFLPLNPNYVEVDKTYLPMYAFNLSAIGWQGVDAGNPSLPQIASVPCYRLYKTGDLSTSTKNYRWESVEGQNANGGNEYIWHREVQNEHHLATPFYRHMWSNIQLLLQCGANCDCTIHTDIVQFKNSCGPRREQVVDVGGLKTKTVFDDEPTADVESSNDVFWESFWAHRVCHPLAKYSNFDKEKNIVFKAKGSIKVNEPAFQNQSTLTNRHVRHIFVNSGKVYDLRDETHEDKTTTGAEVVKLGPIKGVHGANVEPFQYPMWTNQIRAYTENHIYNRDDNKDLWLLVYADMLPGDPLWQADAFTCSFDFKIRNKYEWTASGYNTVTVPTEPEALVEPVIEPDGGV